MKKNTFYWGVFFFGAHYLSEYFLKLLLDSFFFDFRRGLKSESSRFYFLIIMYLVSMLLPSFSAGLITFKFSKKSYNFSKLITLALVALGCKIVFELIELINYGATYLFPNGLDLTAGLLMNLFGDFVFFAVGLLLSRFILRKSLVKEGQERYVNTDILDN